MMGIFLSTNKMNIMKHIFYYGYKFQVQHVGDLFQSFAPTNQPCMPQVAG